MGHQQDRDYLRGVQYKDASNLDARIALHKRFSTNPYDFHMWVYDVLALSPGEHVLEVGCGPGTLWMRNLHRLPAELSIVLTDLSPGMLAQAESNLAASPQPFNYVVADAQGLPFDSDQFDVVVANHMLYHVPDKARALIEIRRVLHGGGRFYAATNGHAHMHKLGDLLVRFDPSLHLPLMSTLDFTLENGAEIIGRSFDRVVMHRYEGGLVVNEAEPLAAYVSSMTRGRQLDEGKLTEFVERELAEHGPIRITQDTGLFEAR